MPNRPLIRSLSQLIGPADALGAVPALQRCLQWALIWQQHEPDSQLAAQLIREIDETLVSLKDTDRLDLRYFPAPRKIGQNVFTRHSLSTSPLWSLTPIFISSHRESIIFDNLAATYLSWVIKTVDQYLDTKTYESWILDKNHQNNPAKTILSSLHEASLSIRRLTEKSLFDLIKRIYLASWNNKHDAYNELLIGFTPDQEEHKRIKRLRSLFKLANGHRPLHRRSRKTKPREKLSNIRHYSNGGTSTYHPVELPDIGSGIIDFPIIRSEDIHGEDTDSISLVGINLKSLTVGIGLDSNSIKYSDLKKLHAIAINKAKHLARSNHYDLLDRRRLHPDELRELDKLIVDESFHINERMAILITLLTGRKIENLRKYPAIFQDGTENSISLRITVNKPTIEGNADCVTSDDTLLVPLPIRWVPTIREFLSSGGDIHTLVTNRTSNGINRSLRHLIIKSKITASAVHRVLPLSLLDITQDEGVASLLADPLTQISTTKNHYICLKKNIVVKYLEMAWRNIMTTLKDDDGLLKAPAQEGYIGASNMPKSKLLNAWLNSKPIAVGTREKELLDFRKQIVREALVLAHRGITDPNPEFLSSPNPDLKCAFAIINDKNRGGKGQMSRIAVLPSRLAQAMTQHDHRASAYTRGSQSLLFAGDARTPVLNQGAVIRPKDLEKSEPRLPCPANGPRKLFRSYAIGRIPGDILDAVMGWQTHGLVPYSEFSSLAPYMTQAICSAHVSSFYDTFSQQEADDVHIEP